MITYHNQYGSPCMFCIQSNMDCKPTANTDTRPTMIGVSVFSLLCYHLKTYYLLKEWHMYSQKEYSPIERFEYNRIANPDSGKRVVTLW